jgi:two-component system CheB/CheR fusion protein
VCGASAAADGARAAAHGSVVFLYARAITDAPLTFKPQAAARTPFTVVGVGASAGGLEAIEGLLAAVPADSELAFVVVQHLDPTHKTMLVEILQRATTMEVIEVHEQTVVEARRVYVIPPNHDLTIKDGSLRLAEPAGPRGLRLPVDVFLRSLAVELQRGAVAVILSGMGSDGTAGARSIKERGGLVLVQDPSVARFDSMPKSVIDAGLADIITTVEAMPKKILGALRRGPERAREPVLSDSYKDALAEIVQLLRAQLGHDFSLYKSTTLVRRIERRMGIHQLAAIADYLRLLQENPVEVHNLFKELLIGVTRFFRDPQSWEYLSKEVLPAMGAAHARGATLRAWVPGCSTGEEAFSLAIAFREQVLAGVVACRLQIFATDLDPDAIDRARRGTYPASIAADLSSERLARFFVADGESYRVRKEIRDMVIFAQQNVLTDPPFTRLDLLSCRNFLIYIEPELQRRLLPIFHYSLNPGGVLFLGSAETIGGHTHLFSPLSAKAKLYRRIEVTPRRGALVFSPASSGGSAVEAPLRRPVANIEHAADKLLLARHSPPAVLINDAGDILYCSGQTGRYLEPPAGKANWNILAMAREGLRLPLTRALSQLRQERGELALPGLKVASEAGERVIDLTATALDLPGPLFGLILVILHEAAVEAPARARKRPAAASEELVKARAEALALRSELQAMQEEQQSSHEEMMSANEELQSTNEELQSTNEELTTSREEMQSMNEELQTLNTELQTKIDELSRASDDMRNLLDSTDIATLFLDSALHVRRFTAQATRLIRLIPSDVGRPVTDITSAINYPELAADAREVLRALVFSERQVTTSDGRWFTAKIMPYRTLEDRIAGVVITFTDITVAKALEAELRRVNDEQTAAARGHREGGAA